jgi:uncharacterized DUF497 family protein
MGADHVRTGQARLDAQRARPRFRDAAEVFAGKHTVLADERFDYGEPRFISAGHLRGRLVVIVWTPRGDARHVTSMKYCHEKEAKRWRQHLGD